MIPLLPKLSLWMKQNQFLIELLMWLILFGFIGFEIILIRGEIRGAGEQLELLRRNTNAVSQQAKILESVMHQQEETLRNVTSMNDAMHRQLAILAAEQKRRIEELAKGPRLEVTVRGTRLVRGSVLAVPYKELTPTSAVYDVEVRNIGNAPARSGSLRMFVDGADVNFICGCPYAAIPVPAHSVRRGIQINFERIPQQEWIFLPVTVLFPAGAREFQIEFVLEAENFLPASAGYILVKPPTLEH